MNEEQVRSALMKGVRTAVRRAFRWSGDHLWPGDTGAENLIQVSVAEALYREAPDNRPAIYLEPTLGRIAPGAMAGDTRRVDIGLLRRAPLDDDEDERFFSVIEIKKHPVRYENDVAKICDILRRVPSVRYAYLVTYFQRHHPERRARTTLAQVMEATAFSIRTSVHARFHCDWGVSTPLARLQDVHGAWEAAVLINRFGRS